MAGSKTYKNVKMYLNELKTGMTLGRDVVTNLGIVLIARNTVLNSIHFTKLEENKIPYVYVKEEIVKREQSNIVTKAIDSEKEHIPVQETEGFIAFQEEYSKKNEEIKNTLLEISDGGKIDLDKLYELTDGIMSSLKYKHDIFSYLHFLKDKDESTFSHSNNVSLLTNLFGQWLGMKGNELLNLTTAASLHDLGKTKIPDEILNKPGKLTDEEFDIMKKHTVFGYRVMESQDIPQEVKLVALTHHEKIDGSGYPLKLKEARISKFSKIVTICDIYDAMTANRVYRGKVCPFDVIKSFEQDSYGLLDTAFLFVFLQNIAYTYIGSRVVLDNGKEGEVVFINRSNLSKPIIRVDNELIDLSVVKDIKIDSVI